MSAVYAAGGWETSPAESTGVPGTVLRAFRRCAVLRALRPDCITFAAGAFVEAALGKGFLSAADATLDALLTQVIAARKSFVCVVGM